jgi:hypothetical protein
MEQSMPDGSKPIKREVMTLGELERRKHEEWMDHRALVQKILDSGDLIDGIILLRLYLKQSHGWQEMP